MRNRFLVVLSCSATVAAWACGGSSGGNGSSHNTGGQKPDAGMNHNQDFDAGQVDAGQDTGGHQVMSGDDDSGPPPAPPMTYSLGGTATGLAGRGLTLGNGTETLPVTASGPFTFMTQMMAGTPYNVTVLSEPSMPTQVCTVNNGMGTITGNVTNLDVECDTVKYTIGGNVAGLTGAGLVLEDNNGDDLTVNSDGSFTFPTRLDSGAAFSVSVKTQPSMGQMCVVQGGSGTVGSGNVSSVVVNCSTTTFIVGGQLSGLNGGTVTLTNNGGDVLPLNANGTFAFPTSLTSGASYRVAVLTQPDSPSQTCTVTGGSGSVMGDVTTVAVSCVSNSMMCSRVVTSMVNEMTSFGASVSVNYTMVGGGGGAGGGPGVWSAGGGGGSSAILNGTSLVAFAAGGNGGENSGVLVPGLSGATASGSFMLGPGSNLTVYVGGGGGGGGFDFGAGGGSGYFGGAGGESWSASPPQGGAGGTDTGGIGVAGGVSGSSQAGGSGGPNPTFSGKGGSAGNGGTTGAGSNAGGGGGGFGGGGGAAGDRAATATAGGSNGASASNSAPALGGLGASTWATATTLPAAAGAGAASMSGQGGNGGLVILTYTSPTGACSL